MYSPAFILTISFLQQIPQTFQLFFDAEVKLRTKYLDNPKQNVDFVQCDCYNSHYNRLVSRYLK